MQGNTRINPEMGGCTTRGTPPPPRPLGLEVAERAVMGILGWSDSGMARCYQHLTAQVRDGIAKQVDGLLWAVDDAQGDDKDDTSGALVRA